MTHGFDMIDVTKLTTKLFEYYVVPARYGMIASIQLDASVFSADYIQADPSRQSEQNHYYRESNFQALQCAGREKDIVFRVTKQASEPRFHEAEWQATNNIYSTKTAI